MIDILFFKALKNRSIMIAGDMKMKKKNNKSHIKLYNVPILRSICRIFKNDSLSDHKAKYSAIFKMAPIGISIADSITGRIIEINGEFARVTGRSIEELQNCDWMSITHPDDLEKDLAQMELLNKGIISNYHMEKRYIKPDNTFVWLNMYVTRISGRQAKRPVHMCMIEDITQQKNTENKLKQSEQRLMTAQDIASIGNWEIDVSTGTLWVSDQVLKIFGNKSATNYFTREQAENNVKLENRKILSDALDALLSDNITYDIEYEILRETNAEKRIVHSHAIAERDENGMPMKVVGSIQDVTELKSTEAALFQSNAILKATLQSTADGILVTDYEGNILFFNEQYQKMWNLPDEIADPSRQKEIHKFVQDSLEEESKREESLPKLIEVLKNKSFEYLLLKDGRTFERYSRPMYIDSIVFGYVLSIRDISERKQWEQALQKNEAIQRAMIANISDTIIIASRDKSHKYVSPNVEKLFGWKADDFINRDLTTLVHPDDLQDVVSEFQHLFEEDGHKVSIEFRFKNKDNIFKYVYLTAVNLENDPLINGVLMNFHDITDQRDREKEITYLSYHDVLTGLYNRAYFEKKLSQLDDSQYLPISVIMGDINGLKLVNDAFGHGEGDKLLSNISNILSENCRSGDVLARIGGDEFCILLPKTSAEEALEICKHIQTDCKNQNERNGQKAFYLSISLGYATRNSDDTRSLKSILADAEDSMYKQKLLERKSLRKSLIASITSTMFQKSNLTAAQEEHMVELARNMGSAMNLPDAQINELELLSTLHDIGELNIEEEILNKPGKLTEEEWIKIKKHPDAGHRIAQASPELSPIADYILSHHERWDGKGYPQGLKGESIPLLSRIVAVIDAYDAMTQDRPYRDAMTETVAEKELIEHSGTQFDPEIVRLFIDVLHGQNKLRNSS